MTGQDLQRVGIIWPWRVSQYSWAEWLGMRNNNHGSQHTASTFPVSGVSLHVLSVTFFLSLVSVLDLEMTRTCSLYRWGTGTQSWCAGCFGCACHPKAPKLGSWYPYCSGTLKGWGLEEDNWLVEASSLERISADLVALGCYFQDAVKDPSDSSESLLCTISALWCSLLGCSWSSGEASSVLLTIQRCAANKPLYLSFCVAVWGLECSLGAHALKPDCLMLALTEALGGGPSWKK